MLPTRGLAVLSALLAFASCQGPKVRAPNSFVCCLLFIDSTVQFVLTCRYSKLKKVVREVIVD